MADHGRAKRLKSSEDGVVAIAEVAELRGRRIAELESENERLRSENAQVEQLSQLRGRNAELESEIEHLRQRRGSHEVLPVVVTATVDLSRIDTSVVTQISSFLGTSRERLANVLDGASPHRL